MTPLSRFAPSPQGGTPLVAGTGPATAVTGMACSAAASPCGLFGGVAA